MMMFRRNSNGIPIVKLPLKHFDDQTAHAVKDRLVSLIAGAGELHLDLGGVETVGSSAVGMLIAVGRRAAEGNGSFVICNLDDHLERLLRLTGVDAFLDFAASSVTNSVA